MAVKQVSNAGSLLQGGSAKVVQPAAPLKISTYNPQKTISLGQLQPAANASINQGGYGYYTPAGGGGGGGGGGGAQAVIAAAAPPPPDPYARWGGYANFEKATNEYNQSKNLTYGSIKDSIDDTVLGTKSSILDFLTSYGQQQKGIDKQAVRSELTRETKRTGILDMIGQGLRNGAVTLNNSNATNSSAADQIGKAYSRMGQKQMIAANQGYNLEQEDIGDAQEALGISAETFRRKYGEDKQTATNKIVQNAVSALAAVDASGANNGVGDRINVESEKNRIRSEALAALGSLDTVFNEGIAKVKPSDRATNRGEAFKLMNSGYVPESKLGFESTLPIYTLGA